MKPKITLEQLPEAVAMLIKEVQEIKNLLTQEKLKEKYFCYSCGSKKNDVYITGICDDCANELEV